MSDVIKELGICEYTNYSIPQKNWIYAEDIRAAIEKLPVVYGVLDGPSDEIGWSETRLGCDTHKARLICVEKLVKEPIKIQFESTVTNHGAQFYDSNKMTELRGKRVRVTVEEVVE